jgi:hypothetical protein
MITSAKADSVVDTISEEAKEAAEQCSGTRPALIALHLVDQISRAELQTMLHTPNGLHTITHAVFKGTNRLHVDSIAFTANPAKRSGRRTVAFRRPGHAEQSAAPLSLPRAEVYLSRRGVTTTCASAAARVRRDVDSR